MRTRPNPEDPEETSDAPDLGGGGSRSPSVGFSGHLWTLGPHLVDRLRRGEPDWTPWEAFLDEDTRRVRVTGRLSVPPRPTRDLVVIVHGMGGSPTSGYCIRAARAALAQGASALRLGLRGAARDGADVYHAGVWMDVATVFHCRALERYDRIFVLGYSLGGHTTLRVGTDADSDRLVAVASVCAPVDLDLGRRWVDERVALFYRKHLLAGLFEIYRNVAKRGPVPTPVHEVEQVRTMYDWDRLTVVPRYGFRDPEDYYATESVASRLHQLRVPALMVCARHDPLVPAHTVSGYVADSASIRYVEVGRGGHVGFPRRIDLGLGGQDALEHQIVRWFRDRP